MWLHIHLAAFIILLIAVIVKLMNPDREMKSVLMMIRLIYLVLIVTGGRLVMFTFDRDPVLSIVKILLALATIAFAEIAFGKKGTPSKRKWLIGLMIITAVVGLVLAGGQPFVS